MSRWPSQQLRQSTPTYSRQQGWQSREKRRCRAGRASSCDRVPLLAPTRLAVARIDDVALAEPAVATDSRQQGWQLREKIPSSSCDKQGARPAGRLIARRGRRKRRRLRLLGAFLAGFRGRGRGPPVGVLALRAHIS